MDYTVHGVKKSRTGLRDFHFHFVFKWKVGLKTKGVLELENTVILLCYGDSNDRMHVKDAVKWW